MGVLADGYLPIKARAHPDPFDPARFGVTISLELSPRDRGYRDTDSGVNVASVTFFVNRHIHHPTMSVSGVHCKPSAKDLLSQTLDIHGRDTHGRGCP